MGRLPKFFLATDKKVIDEFNLMMWPGYSPSVKLFTDGIFLNVDTATKFIQGKTVLDDIRGMERERYSKKEIIDYLIPKET